MRINVSSIRKNSIIEICTVPDVQIHCIMKEMSEAFKRAYFIDTIGNLKYILEGVIEVYSLRKFIREIKNLKGHTDFALFIDSITFIGDKGDGFSSTMDLLMDLITYNNATIILSNHYSYVKGNIQSHFVPRMGLKFGSMMHYRIFFVYKNNKLSYEIVDNNIVTSGG